MGVESDQSGARGPSDPTAEPARRLRERALDAAVPDLATALLDARGPDDFTRTELDETYRTTLVVCFRLLVVAVAEARGHLPTDDARYRPHSLAWIASNAAQGAFDPDSKALWNDVNALFEAIHEGRSDWGIPAYGGRLFASVPADHTPDDLDLPDDRFGPVLADLQLESVDFADLDLRTLGAIYEELVGLELAIDSGEGSLHGRSGERKSTGTYYTKPRFVAHLLDHALEPALDDHCDRLDGLDEREATEQFFEFRVADLAMGTGGFLLAALDRIASRLSAYLDERSLPAVEAELERLREDAESALEPCGRSREIDREGLLRRLVARRCLFGVDSDPLATELARRTLWLAAFVPGLPATSLDGNLVAGDSLSGIGTVAEAVEILDDADPVTDPESTLRETIAERPDQREAIFDVLAAVRVEDDLDPAAAVETEPRRWGEVHERARTVLDPLDPVHFPAAFPAVFAGEQPGFDVLVGNPPWEESILDRDAFWTRFDPGLQREESHGGTKGRRVARLRDRRPDLASRFEREKRAQQLRRAVLTSGPYPGVGTGDPDTYKAFCWRNWALLRDGGCLGLVLPRGAFVGAGSADFRRELLDRGVVTDLTFLKNRNGWAFEGVGPRYTVGLLACRKTVPPSDGTLPIRGPFPDAERFESGVERDPHRFPVEAARRWTDSLLFPLLPANPRSVEVFERMARHPRLDRDDSTAWRARPYRELDETTDRTADDGTTLIHRTDEPPKEGCWPVLDGASLNPPDDPQWIMDTGARFGWADPEVLIPYLQEARENSYRFAGTRSAFAEFEESWVRDGTTLPCLEPRIAFRHVTQRTNSRTICASLVPPEVFLTNAAPYVLWPRGDERDQAYLLGVLNSIPFDWYARLFVEANVNYHILNALRVPRPGRESPLRRRVEELAGRLATRDDRYADWAEAVGVECGPLEAERELALLAELDAVVAHLYGLSRANLTVVFETFHRNWEYEERLDAVLAYFESWEGRLA